MRKSSRLLLTVSTLAGGPWLTACGEEGTTHDAEPAAEATPKGDAHDHDHDQGELPDEYENMVNPLSPDEQVLSTAAALYDQHCAGCHGEEGRGDGMHGHDLDPRPSDLTGEHIAEASDGYLFYRISEGGAFEPYNSAMPAFEDLLSEHERWHLVTHLRHMAGHGHSDEHGDGADDHADGDAHDDGAAGDHGDGDHGDGHGHD